MIIERQFLSILHKSQCCECSFDSPQQINSNEHPQHRFYGEMSKSIPQLSSLIKNSHLIYFSELSSNMLLICSTEGVGFSLQVSALISVFSFISL